MHSQLLCTLTRHDSLDDVLDTIDTTYDVVNHKVFVLSTDDDTMLACTYNIILPSKVRFIPDTFLAHRKRETNTIYTINALNALVIELCGSRDVSYVVPWSDYKNMLLVLDGEDVQFIPTTVYDIITFR